MTKYAFDSVELALQKCKEELRNEFANASSYAFVFDARTKIGDDLVPMLIFQMEERGQGFALNFSQKYEFKKRLFSTKIKFRAKEEFQAMGKNTSFSHRTISLYFLAGISIRPFWKATQTGNHCSLMSTYSK